MNKLLLFLFLVITPTATLMAQVGTDPYLVDPDGSPVMVPSRSSGPADFGGANQDRPKYEISGTLRGAGRNVLGESLPPKDDFEYTSSVHLSDTSRVFVIDQEGNPIRDMDGVYSDPQQTGSDGVLGLFPSE